MKTKLARKLVPHLLWGFLCYVPAQASVLSANFDSLGDRPSVGSTYSEGGITFSSTSVIDVADSYLAPSLFGWGNTPHNSDAIYVETHGWLSLSAPNMCDVAFTYGFYWNGYLIEEGSLVTAFNWQAYLNGVLVDSGSTLAPPHSHGGGTVHVTSNQAFDTLLLSSTSPGHGDLNLIALDNVLVTCAEGPSVPDYGNTALLIGFAIGLFECFRPSKNMTN